MNAYKAAVEKYRFFSYGDAMFITAYNPQAINERVRE